MVPIRPTNDAIDGERAVDRSFFVDDASKMSKYKKLPKWFYHFNTKDLKLLFKASLAVWIMTIFIFIDGTLNILGQSAFFGWYDQSVKVFHGSRCSHLFT
jgi:hypothetical protein